MQIDIDFEVFKALTAMRRSESDSYNAVIARLIGLHSGGMVNELASNRPFEGEIVEGSDTNDRSPDVVIEDCQATRSYIADALNGAWFGGVCFPEGTRFRATYKGESYFAEIKNRRWIDHIGRERTSPSHAATAITGTNVNGWRFWFAQMPGDPKWRRLEELKP